LWDIPKTISDLRAFLVLTNYHSSFIHKYAELVAAQQEKLKVQRHIRKKGSRYKVERSGDFWRKAFNTV
jgi:hypothetical protein